MSVLNYFVDVLHWSLWVYYTSWAAIW